jgi:hypothetical protein
LFFFCYFSVANSERDNIFLGEISVTSELSVMPDLLLSIQSTILGWINQLYLLCLVI